MSARSERTQAIIGLGFVWSLSWGLSHSASAGFLEEFVRSPRHCLLDAWSRASGKGQVSPSSPIEPPRTAPPIQHPPAELKALPQYDYDAGAREWEKAVKHLDAPTVFQLREHRRTSHSERMSLARAIPRRTISQEMTLRLQYDSVFRHAPEKHRQVLSWLEEAFLHPGRSDSSGVLGEYLNSVADEMGALALNSKDTQIRASAVSGGPYPEELLEQVLFRRIQAQGFPPPVKVEGFLNKEEFGELLKTAPAFVDEVDRSVAALKAQGRVPLDQPRHGRLTHIVALDYAGYFLRSKSVPPERLRETLLWAGGRDSISRMAVWGYLFDQAPGASGTRGISTPDVLNGLMEEAWNLEFR